MIESPLDLLLEVTRRLDTLKVPYLITGGIAVSLWGKPRFTEDIDLIIGAQINNSKEIFKAFENDFYLSEEAITKALSFGGEFNIIHNKSGLKVDFWISKDEFTRLRFKNKKKKKLEGKPLFFSSAEDLILSKLLWFKESQSTRHLEDIVSIVKVQDKNLNYQYIRGWAKKLSVLEIFEELKF